MHSDSTVSQTSSHYSRVLWWWETTPTLTNCSLVRVCVGVCVVSAGKKPASNVVSLKGRKLWDPAFPGQLWTLHLHCMDFCYIILYNSIVLSLANLSYNSVALWPTTVTSTVHAYTSNLPPSHTLSWLQYCITFLLQITTSLVGMNQAPKFVCSGRPCQASPPVTIVTTSGWNGQALRLSYYYTCPRVQSASTRCNRTVYVIS